PACRTAASFAVVGLPVTGLAAGRRDRTGLEALPAGSPTEPSPVPSAGMIAPGESFPATGSVAEPAESAVTTPDVAATIGSSCVSATAPDVVAAAGSAGFLARAGAVRFVGEADAETDAGLPSVLTECDASGADEGFRTVVRGVAGLRVTAVGVPEFRGPALRGTPARLPSPEPDIPGSSGTWSAPSVDAASVRGAPLGVTSVRAASPVLASEGVAAGTESVARMAVFRGAAPPRAAMPASSVSGFGGREVTPLTYQARPTSRPAVFSLNPARKQGNPSRIGHAAVKWVPPIRRSR
ncbi:MAG: hypothetical protein JWQ68_480, partial [Cryobacterium sp.]|nr:hypothetical protein [Cryobacterium sp.]